MSGIRAVFSVSRGCSRRVLGVWVDNELRTGGNVVDRVAGVIPNDLVNCTIVSPYLVGYLKKKLPARLIAYAAVLSAACLRYGRAGLRA